MTRDDILAAVLDALSDVAPEADPAAIKPDVDLRDQLDIDSMDFLNFVIGLNQQVGVDVPERDYPSLATLDGCVDYLAQHLPVAAS
jgi:acyl carrier protein